MRVTTLCQLFSIRDKLLKESVLWAQSVKRIKNTEGYDAGFIAGFGAAIIELSRHNPEIRERIVDPVKMGSKWEDRPAYSFRVGQSTPHS